MIKRFYILLLAIVASVGMSWATTTDLASITDNYTAQDGDILTGTLGVSVKISIADGATVTLLNANINGDKTLTTGQYAGLTCLGDATITIVGTNSVSGYNADNATSGFPGIYVPSGKTLIINGTGSLTAQSSVGDAAGIGAGGGTHCGNIVIQSGKITAIAGAEDRGAGIGGAYNANCGNITISGGIVTAVGGYNCPGIGGGRRKSGSNAGHCGNILISGGVVSATSGEGAAAIGSGQGVNSANKTNCGTITITNTALKVYADRGGSSANTIGAGKNGTCGTVTIGGNTGVINDDPYTYRTKEDGEIVVDYINAIGSVVYTQECKDKIDIARELYDALEGSQIDLVINYQTLLDAEAAYAALIPQPGPVADLSKDIEIDLRGQQLGGDGETGGSKYLIIDSEDNYTYVDDEPAAYNAHFAFDNFNGTQHGYTNLMVTAPVTAGKYRLTLGTCQYGTGTGNVMSETNIELASFDQKTAACYHQNPAENIISMIFDVDQDQHITIDCGNYTPYMKLEAVTAYKVSFALSDAEGTAPTAVDVTIGEDITMPVNKTMYKAGYTLTGWSDGVNTYPIGESFTPANDVVLTPVFTANEADLLNASSDVTVIWYFGGDNGAPTTSYEGTSGLLVAQATIGDKIVDVKLSIDATSGKFAPQPDTEWAQVRVGTIFTYPYKEGMTVNVGNYNSKVTYYIADTEGKVTCGTNDYYSFIQVTYPASTPVVNLKLIEFQVPASWENDNTPISSADFPDFVATTYEIASALPVTSEPALVVFDFPGDDEVSVYTKVSGQVSKASTGTIVREAFFGQPELHYYYPVLAGDEPEPTGVENVQTNQVQATKFFRDGQLLIEKNGKLFNLTGAQVK